MSQLKADTTPAKKVRPYDPSPLRRPAITPQYKWAKKWVVEQRYLPRTQFLKFTKFKIMSREKRGAAELFRILFNYADIPYEDVFVTNLDWKSLICKTPYGNLPVLWMDHNVYGEPNVIIRLLGRHLQLMGVGESENLIADAVLQQVFDLRDSEVLQLAFEELLTRPDDNVEQTFTVLLPKAFDSWESHLKASTSHFILDSGLSLADMAIFDFLNQYRDYLPMDNLIEEHPELHRLYKVVSTHPMLTQYFRKESVRTRSLVLKQFNTL